MRKTATIFTTLLALLLPAKNRAAESDSLTGFAQTGIVAGNGDFAPYWFTANRNGLLPVGNSGGQLRAGIAYNGSFGNENFHYRAVADIVAGYNQQRGFVIQQAYGEIDWRCARITVGSKERWSENEYFTHTRHTKESNNVEREFPFLHYNSINSLGSGGLAFSGNSRPIPQVRIEIPHYTAVPGTNKWLQVRGHISYGMFSDQNYQEEFTRPNPKARYARNILYHSKALFLKVGKPSSFPLTVEGGVEMHTEFGGDIYNRTDGLLVSMPREPMDFFKAFIPLGGSDDTPTVEQTNISGNQIGSWHLALTLHTKPADVRFYAEHLFEDFSQLFFFEYQSNKEGKRKIIYYPWRDILVGVNIENKSAILPFISNIRYEYLTTRDQSGALYNDPNEYFKEQMDGCDNYYNHGIYPGWHHWGMGIGNPLAYSPEYNTDGSTQFRGNRLIAHNFGINGQFSNTLPLKYRFSYTYSENWGTYANPFAKKKYTTSLFAGITFAPRNSNWLGSVSVGYDKSNFIGENLGVMFTLTRVGTIFKRK